MIVKVQRPLSTGLGPDEPNILIYDHSKDHLEVQRARDLPDWLRQALDAAPKVFAQADWVGRSWKFSGMAKWQDW
jgi:hypothetical protein